ncbi:sel1 repeat family protein [Rhizobiaceae bacterium n13]|uniref:Sel1 repeat family protein n=1 Tax=Ferirhizobium litorale TaxID=2927786 RepID=A0AAE3QCC8_9HYPH|nr:tetratricopeptide repeat protein [Fererhizobium litorale]MDI7862231.1 sel1 repeat family protein [Fererhizobium litorale]MDI7922495.1 sel1 repeat family protein [Fererhizobium litorale]
MYALSVLRSANRLQIAGLPRLLAVAIIMGAVAPAAAGQKTPATNDCDRLAGSRYDGERNRGFKPVDADSINVDAALEACSAALDATNAPRFAFQLGRVQDRAGEISSAVDHYSRAANAGYAIALVHLGAIAGRMGDAQQEFRYFTEAAEKGNALGAYNLGVAYRDGNGTNVDGALAIKWFTRASVQGYDVAAFNLGAIYDEGKIVPEDNRLAINWYNIAAARGNVDAMINLGLMLESGEGTDRNIAAAAIMYREAAARGDSFGSAKFEALRSVLVAQDPGEVEHQARVVDDGEHPGKDAGPTPVVRRKAI